jgi:hypothetical protein
MSTLQTRNDSFEHGDLVALLCIGSPELQELAIDQITQLGFAIHTAFTAEEANSKLTTHPYNIVAIEENLEGTDAQTHPILAELAALRLDARRDLFVVLIGPGMETQSDSQAFGLSVDLTINLADAPNLKTLVGRGIVAQEEFYAAFNAVKKDVQRAG